MALRERLDEDLKTAMRARDEVRRSVLRMVRSEIHNEEIARQQPLDDEAIVGVLSRQARRNRESISEFRKGQREDLIQQEEAELQVLMEYLPTQLAPEDVVDLARTAILETGAKGPTDKGKVMAKLMPQVRGKAEGSTVNDIVTELLEKL